MRIPRKLLLAAAAVVGLSTLAYGLTVPASISPRRVPWQTTTHYRWTINFNDALTSSARVIGAVPAKAFITNMDCQVLAIWQNAGTGTGNTNLTQLNLATTSAATVVSGLGGGDWVNGAAATTAACQLGTLGYQAMSTVNGLGMSVTSPATPTGSSGGWDIFARLYSSSGTPTTGQVVVIFEYVPDDDM